MKKLFLLITMIILADDLCAQLSTSIRVKAGEDLYQKLAQQVYIYPSFKKGTITFRDGRYNQSLFNYNMLARDVQFIDEKGDTLSLANELTIKHVVIAEDTFFYDDGYLLLIAGNESAKLTRKQVIKVMDKQKIGAYDQPTSAGSISSYNSISNSVKSFSLDVRQDLLLAKQTTYFIGDRFNKFFRASKKNVLKNFYSKQDMLNNYFKRNNVDFNSEKDLTALIKVLN